MAVTQRSALQRAARHASRSYHAAPPAKSARLTVGIRREDPQRTWERRCPLTPDAVHELVHKDGVQVLVQPCERRVYTADDFLKAGATLHPTLAPAHTIIGIKETPLAEVLTDPVPAPHGAAGSSSTVPRTHVMFSHTIKGQLYNMELLSKYLSSESASEGALLPRLIDYELLVGEDGKRTVGFGWFAGVAGALESLCALAHAHLDLGVASPFLYTPRPNTQPTLESIRNTLRHVVGARIASEGTPKSLGPIVIGVTGNGKVSDGVLSILDDLPTQRVRVEDLRRLVTDPNTDLHRVYIVHAQPQDYFVRRDGQSYDRAGYYARPQDHTSEFHTKIAPYLSLLIHGAGWAQGFPRLMTNAQLATTLETARTLGKGRFACVGDISCDLEGGLEFLDRHTTLSSPFYAARPACLPAHLPPVTMMSVDILPTALPSDASAHFSRVFLPYLREILAGYRPDVRREEGSGLKEALERATVAREGKLTESFAWLQGSLNQWKASESTVEAANRDPPPQGASKAAAVPLPKKRILMLGSGMVAPPAVDEICSRPDVELIVASNILSEAERLTAQHANATAVVVDMKDTAAVESLVAAADVVISLLPVPFHPAVADLCIRNRKHLVTASYISPAMRALHDKAVAADVVLMNEIGLDPGIDHCSALSLIESLRAQNKEVVSFTSFCGGLPAPEAADVPLGYKFSWSPKGVLTAASNDALFKVGGKEHRISGDKLLQRPFSDVPLSNVLKFEGLANRNSLPYASVYGLEPLSDIRTIFRGTLRYPGFSDLMSSFKAIGLLDANVQLHPEGWSALIRHTLAQRLGKPIATEHASVVSALNDIVAPKHRQSVVQALEWLSLLPSSGAGAAAYPAFDPSLPALPSGPAPAIDFFAALLAHKLRYTAGERDLVVLSHEIVARPKGGVEEEVHTSSLVAYGAPEASAMSRCVGLPVAFAALQVVDGRVSARGVQGPTDKEVYTNILERLTAVGLGVRESVRKAVGGGYTTESSLRDSL